MLVWATKDGRFGYGKARFGKEEQLTVVLDKAPGDAVLAEIDITPPVEGSIPVEVTDEQRAANGKKLGEEDAIRNTYEKTFYTSEKASALAAELQLDAKETTEYLLKSRGNWAEIEKFLRETPAEKRALAMALLSVISTKDLRDTPASVLFDHLNHTPGIPTQLIAQGEDQDLLFRQYVLNPRVANEFLSAYKQFFLENVSASLANEVDDNPHMLAGWVKEHIALRNDLNPQRVPIMPPGVWKARIADERSRSIFFVAIARSMGIPARIEEVAGKVQYYSNGWVDVNFESDQPTVAAQGFVTASYTAGTLDNPKYYSHFTIAKILADGRLQTLNFERHHSVDMGEGDTWSGLLKKPLAIDEGNYLLVSGTRMAGGNVLARIVSFTVKPGETASVDLVMRENQDDIQVIGSIDAEAKFKPSGSDRETTILNTTGRGYFILAVLGARQEPTNHALRDIAALKKEFEQWNRSIVLLFKDEQGLKAFDGKEFGELPSTITYGIDTDHRITDMLVGAMKLPSGDTLPIFVIADTFGRVVFVSQGYTIGLGEQMQKVIRKL
jgi:hypothetical protein